MNIVRVNGPIFLDREDGGRQLAALLTHLREAHPLVLALPRGGVPVAFEVARTLNAPLEVLVVRKLGAPNNVEYAVGAIAESREDIITVLDDATVHGLSLTPASVDAIIVAEHLELRRRIQRYRGGRSLPDLRDRTVIIVDDGLATGLSDIAAARAVRAQNPKHIVIAVPVASAQAVTSLQAEADEVICHTIPKAFFSVGNWYHDFSALSDLEVLTLLTGDTPTRVSERAFGGREVH